MTIHIPACIHFICSRILITAIALGRTIICRQPLLPKNRDTSADAPVPKCTNNENSHPHRADFRDYSLVIREQKGEKKEKGQMDFSVRVCVYVRVASARGTKL
ncbi:hypothetical protein AFLA_001528 [Aspergillus flavus NRRL3357]|nr:hypothetical protein AFLA_001528 [Aspergillus flavus NRRL3357]